MSTRRDDGSLKTRKSPPHDVIVPAPRCQIDPAHISARRVSESGTYLLEQLLIDLTSPTPELPVRCQVRREVTARASPVDFCGRIISLMVSPLRCEIYGYSVMAQLSISCQLGPQSPPISCHLGGRISCHLGSIVPRSPHSGQFPGTVFTRQGGQLSHLGGCFLTSRCGQKISRSLVRFSDQF